MASGANSKFAGCAPSFLGGGRSSSTPNINVRASRRMFLSSFLIEGTKLTHTSAQGAEDEASFSNVLF